MRRSIQRVKITSMPKASKNKYYAVKLGREGPKIYNTWDEYNANVSRYPGAVHKSFTSRTQAEEWMKVPIPLSLGFSHGKALLEDNVPSNIRILAQASTLPSVPKVPMRETGSTPREPTPILSDRDTGLSTPDCVSQIVLSSEQAKVLQMVQQGQNVFFTGSAGTGKSVLLREIIKTLGGATSSTLGITASTGIASVNIGGTTIHSWAGIGLGQEPAKNLAGKILGQSRLASVLKRWREARALIIDEVSMIDGILFDKLEYIARILRNCREPFGGIQLILSGDFCQLPPVPERREGVQIPSKFAFESETWNQCVGKPITLSKVFRQKDQAFINMLNAMRLGELDAKAVEEFKKLSRPVEYPDGIGPTQLYPTRREVDNANETQLKQLPDSPHTYQASDVPGLDSKRERVSQQSMERLLERLIAAKTVTLKLGAQVMLIKNLIQGQLVNGSVGQVVGFSTSNEALKSHTEIAQVDDTTNPQGAQKMRNRAAQNDRVWPVVRFTNGKTMLLVPTDFTVNNAEGEIEASREQIPLILAWALSVHKSQGQTLERVKVDLGRIFEKGQAYVALSRATNMQTLEVLNFHPSKVMAHPRVLHWHKNFEQDDVCFDDDFDDEMDNYEAMANYHGD